MSVATSGAQALGMEFMKMLTYSQYKPEIDYREERARRAFNRSRRSRAARRDRVGS